MSAAVSPPRLTSIIPLRAVEGGRLRIEGTGFSVSPDVPEVSIGNAPARVVFGTSRSLDVLVPPDVEGGETRVRVEGIPGATPFVEIGRVLATGVHQVDNPVCDRAGNVYLTYSGSRGQQAPVSIFRVTPSFVREPFVSGIVNATSMAFDTTGTLYVSSRFEGAVYRVEPDGSFEPIAADLGVACGLAFGADGTLYVGDRSGTIFRLSVGGEAEVFATLPSSVAAFHLAMGPDGCLYATAPTLASRDAVYRLDHMGRPEVVYAGFGRPQGLAFDAHGTLHVVEALVGSSGLYRLRAGAEPELVVSAPSLVGVAFAPDGSLIVSSNDTAYRFLPSGGGRLASPM